MMRKSWTKWILTAVIALVLIAGVPIIINECYKTNSGYMTIWGAADALAYYGAIIASIGAALGVFVSIKAATKNYRDDVRARVMPFIAVTPFERKATVNTMALLREKVEEKEKPKDTDDTSAVQYDEYKLYYIFRIKYQTPADKRNIVVIDLNRINNLSYDDKLFEISIDGMMVEKIVNTSTDIHKINITEMVDSNIKINDYFTPSLYEVLKSKIN